MSINTFYEWALNQDVLGSLLSVVSSVFIIEYLLPKIRSRKSIASSKLTGFYNVAYAFIKIRENFSIEINGEIHNKENCGFFHNFQFPDQSFIRRYDSKKVLLSYDVVDRSDTFILFNESLFLNYVSQHLESVDQELRDYLLEYLKARGPEDVQKKIGCKDSKLIDLREKIEELIIRDYKKYQKMHDDN